MAEEESCYRWRDGDLMLSVRVKPRAKRDELIGPQSGYLRVHISAPPVEGKANQHLQRFLAKEFDVPRSRVQLIAGSRTSFKRFCIRTPRKLPAFIRRG